MIFNKFRAQQCPNLISSCSSHGKITLQISTIKYQLIMYLYPLVKAKGQVEFSCPKVWEFRELWVYITRRFWCLPPLC